MTILARLAEAAVTFFRARRKRWCRHDLRREDGLIRRPGAQFSAGEQRYRCTKCGATRQEGIF